MPTTNKPITLPSIGQDVFYSPSLQEATETGQHGWSAKITAVHDDKTVNVCIFLPSGHTRARWKIPIFQSDVDAKECGKQGDYCFIQRINEEFFDKLMCEKN